MHPIAKRFGWGSAATMVAAAVAAVALNAQLQGSGFAGSRGVPFAWYEWRDVGPPGHRFHPLALIADLVLALGVLGAIGVVTEWLLHPAFRWLSVAALLLASLVATWMLWRSHGTHDLSLRGTPFAWECWSAQDTRLHAYNWFALLGDVLLSVVLVGGAALGIETVAKRRSRVTS
jgi:hypothetical protein